MTDWDIQIESMLDEGREATKQRIKELYSIIWLIVYTSSNHEVKIPEIAFKILDKNGAFTVWDNAENGSLVIKAYSKE